jgi:hypothetical protein
MKDSVLLKPQNETAETIVPKNGKFFELEELQAFVGGFIESVYHDDTGWFFVNEDGKRLNMTPNAVATRTFRQLTKIHDTILGPAVFVATKHFAPEDD